MKDETKDDIRGIAENYIKGIEGSINGKLNPVFGGHLMDDMIEAFTNKDKEKIKEILTVFAINPCLAISSF